MRWPLLIDKASTTWSLPICESMLRQHLTRVRQGLTHNLCMPGAKGKVAGKRALGVD